MKQFVTRCTLACVIVLGSIAGSVSAAPIFYGPTPYLSFADSPFKGIPFSQFYLETFEGGALNTPGVVAVNNNPGGSVLGVIGPSEFTDSVDGDDGVIDGSGTNGHSFFPSANDGGDNFGDTFTFNSVVLGGFPTHVGIVWTDGSQTAPTLFEAFDALGNSLGTIGPVQIGDDSFAGTTAEDRFFGVANPAGISRIVLRDPDGVNSLEVDHLQYGIAQTSTPVPEPTSFALLSIGVVSLAAYRWRQRKRRTNVCA